MLADPTFAEMVQAIGVASLGADEKQIWHLTKVSGYLFYGCLCCKAHSKCSASLCFGCNCDNQ